MYFKNTLIQTIKCFLISVVLTQMGCQEKQPEKVKLDLALKKHFSLISDGKSGSARVRLRQYMDEYGESSDALFLMGLSYHVDRYYSKAGEWFKKGVALQTDNIYPPTWHFLGWTALYLGELEESKMAFNHFLLLEPNEADTLFALGLIALEEGDLNVAKVKFTRSIQETEDIEVHAKATARLADLNAELGNWNKSIVLYEEALTLNPDLYEAWYRLSRVLRRTGQENESNDALQAFERARRRVRPDLHTQTRFPE
jgi:tetratricopeptide (TPR) repeat protein